MRSSCLLILFLCVLSLATGLPCDAPEVRAESAGVQPRGSDRTEPSGFNPGTWLIRFYRENISPVDGDRCPSIPSCSSYSLQAIEKHGFFLGWMMTVDRLIHEGEEESRVSPVVYSEGQWKIFDPVENNDYWWHSPNRNEHD